MNSKPSTDRFTGCLLGLALGDAFGAPYEGGPIERALWRLIGTTPDGDRRFTDDTQMSIDLAESLIERGGFEADDVVRRFAESYRWTRGYGPSAAKILRRIRRGKPWSEASRSVYPEGSLGNGGAMRSPVIGLYCAARPDALVPLARASAQITHAHPLGVEGAVLIASAVRAGLDTPPVAGLMERASAHCSEPAFKERLVLARAWLAASEQPAPDEIAHRLGHGIVAAESCVTALYLGLRFLERPFMELQAFVVRVGGDVDTIGAMAGAIWGVVNGAKALPETWLGRLEQRARIQRTAEALHSASAS